MLNIKKNLVLLKLDYFDSQIIIVSIDSEFKVLSLEIWSKFDLTLNYKTSYFLCELELNEIPLSGIGAIFQKLYLCDLTGNFN